jgi:hypothetical protein
MASEMSWVWFCWRSQSAEADTSWKESKLYFRVSVYRLNLSEKGSATLNGW